MYLYLANCAHCVDFSYVYHSSLEWRPSPVGKLLLYWRYDHMMVLVVLAAFPQDEVEYSIEVVIGVKGHLDPTLRRPAEMNLHVGL